MPSSDALLEPASEPKKARKGMTRAEKLADDLDDLMIAYLKASCEGKNTGGLKRKLEAATARMTALQDELRGKE